MKNKISMGKLFIYDFICSTHPSGRTGFNDEGFEHYMNILPIIKDKMFNPDKPESKFVTLCFEENWEYAKAVADTRNKEAIEFCDMFKLFVNHVKKSAEYIQFTREQKLNKIL